MPQSYAVMGDTQFLPGYCVLLADDPDINCLTDLPKRKRVELLESMDTLGEGVETGGRAADAGFRRMNYEILGTTDAFLHADPFPANHGRRLSTSAGRYGCLIRGSSVDLMLGWRPGTTPSVSVSSLNSRALG